MTMTMTKTKPSPTTKYQRILDRLAAITIGCTSVVYDRVVTRWAEDRYEIDTLRHGGMSRNDAASILMA